MSNEHDASTSAPRPEPLPLVASTGRDEPCPNCGRPLASPTDVLCIHCGYDLSAVVQRSTVVGRPVVDAERGGSSPVLATSTVAPESSSQAQADSPRGGVLVPRRALPVPLITAGLCALAMIIGYLAGLGGLFPRVDDLFRAADGTFTSSTVRWPERLIEASRFGVRSGLTWAAALLAIAFVARLRATRPGDFATLAARTLAIVTAASMMRLIQLPDRWFETSLELVLQCAVFVGLVSLWLRLSLMEAAQALAGTAILMLVLHGAALAIVWAS